ncbi:MAG: DNA-directed RNA polymerase subunit E'' [Candidatus Woesearchaeota archaeon]|jgi:RNA polymerase subunit RPABC4/transcription elongation factor Spt4|nr:DNA-directed RNA polymerase subunit E'' [Candidatus Woesearchaeota archaeon]
MVNKKKVCKECGFLTEEKNCPNCKSNQLQEKYKGTVYILDAKESEVAKKIDKSNKGIYALKY